MSALKKESIKLQVGLSISMVTATELQKPMHTIAAVGSRVCHLMRDLVSSLAIGASYEFKRKMIATCVKEHPKDSIAAVCISEHCTGIP